MAMVRPRQGGFCNTQVEYNTALADVEALLAHGADGLVFGFVNEDGALYPPEDRYDVIDGDYIKRIREHL